MKYQFEVSKLYTEPAFFIDSSSPAVIDYALANTNANDSKLDQAVSLYYAVRDGFRYDPYQINLTHTELKASTIIKRENKYGYCVEKACVLAAAARVLGIPSRLGFANVRNHIGTEKIEAHLKTDVLVFHGFTEFYLEGKWVKSTPAFNKELCAHLNVEPLPFNGREDSIFQEYSKAGGQYMEYLHDYGTFHDVPHDLFVKELIAHYPHFFE